MIFGKLILIGVTLDAGMLPNGRLCVFSRTLDYFAGLLTLQN